MENNLKTENLKQKAKDSLPSKRDLNCKPDNRANTEVIVYRKYNTNISSRIKATDREKERKHIQISVQLSLSF